MAAKENEILHLLLQVFFFVSQIWKLGRLSRARERESASKCEFYDGNFDTISNREDLIRSCLLIFGSSPHLYTSGGEKYKQFNGRRRPPSLSQIVRQIKNLFFSLFFFMAMHFGGKRTVVKRKGKNAEMPTTKTITHECISVSLV